MRACDGSNRLMESKYSKSCSAARKVSFTHPHLPQSHPQFDWSHGKYIFMGRHSIGHMESIFYEFERPQLEQRLESGVLVEEL
jgi:hypothetical protein